MTFCPDCGQLIDTREFVIHRETEHPPKTKVITIPDALDTRPGDARRGERMGWEE